MAKLAPLKLPEPKEDIFSAIDPIDSRYRSPEIGRYLSEASRIAYQAYVEAALAQTLADFKICNRTTANQITAATKKVTAQAVYKEEQITKHDIKALVNCIKHQLPESAKPFVHFGATSYDIISTATNLQLRDATQQLVLPRLKELISTLLVLTKAHAQTVQIGRTHGQHAVPITFGFAMSEYVSRLGENYLALRELSTALPGKFSGAVGAYNAISLFVSDPLQFEKTVLGYVGMKPAPYSTQIVPAEYAIRLIDELAISAGIMANLAHDMRHLQRSEIAEVRESFAKGQTGSSTMAHKRNPWNFENIISMSKQVTAQLINANLNISSEHQRDLTDSASSRFYPLVLAIVASMTKRLNEVMAKIEIDEFNMQRNLHLSQGAIAAEPLYLLLEKYGHSAAHESVKVLAHKAIRENRSLYDVASHDKKLASYWQRLSKSEQQLVDNPEEMYVGLASKKALIIYDHWRSRLGY